MSGAATPSAETRPRHMPRFSQLDGWRAISILAVLCAHFLPLGPAHWELNISAGLLGMSIFFTLSGFLITSTLYFQPSVRVFVIRRVFRIVPLALLYMVLCLFFLHVSWNVWLAHIFFYVNLPPFRLTKLTLHMWSLCVEMHYYALTAALFLLLRQRSFVLAPLLALTVTALRIHAHMTSSIVTIYRLDEILAGATLAYLLHGQGSVGVSRVLSRIPPLVPLLLLLLSTHVYFVSLNYLRPYLAALTVGTTLMPNRTRWVSVLSSKPLKYIAGISYALYVWQGLAHSGWFEGGPKTVKYAKRPLGICLTFLLAHLSSKYFEPFWIRLGKKLSAQVTIAPTPTDKASLA